MTGGRCLLACLTWLLVLVGALPATAAPELARGVVLVADAGIGDPRFRQSVILLLQHDRSGTAGVILNRPTRFDLSPLLPESGPEGGQSQLLHYGGPVEPDRLLALAAASDPPPAATVILEGLYLLAPEQALERLRLGQGPVRLYSGYAGWVPGQLAAEIARGDWQVVPGMSAWVFDAAPETLWERLRPGPAVFI